MAGLDQSVAGKTDIVVGMEVAVVVAVFAFAVEAGRIESLAGIVVVVEVEVPLVADCCQLEVAGRKPVRDPSRCVSDMPFRDIYIYIYIYSMCYARSRHSESNGNPHDDVKDGRQ